MRDVPWEDILKLSSSAAASEFCEGFRLELMYIYSSPWFSAACAALVVHRNYFYRFYQKNKSSESKVKFRQVVIVAKGFLKLPNLHMLIKQKNPSLPRNVALRTLDGLPILQFPTKVICYTSSIPRSRGFVFCI